MSNTLEDYGIAYIPVAPVEVAIVSFAPFLIASGFGWVFAFGTVGVGIAIPIAARLAGWWGAGTSFGGELVLK